jgi:hypothetical protein
MAAGLRAEFVIAPDGTIRIVPVEQVQPVKPVAMKREVVM